jgi:hypothetical protein
VREAAAGTMIDHVLGRPSVQFRKIQVLAVVSFWSFYLYRYVCQRVILYGLML